MTTDLQSLVAEARSYAEVLQDPGFPEINTLLVQLADALEHAQDMNFDLLNKVTLCTQNGVESVVRIIEERDEARREVDQQGRVLAEREDEIEELATQRDEARARVEQLGDRLATSMAEVERLREALGVYANGSNWLVCDEDPHPTMGHYLHFCGVTDFGPGVAREALRQPAGSFHTHDWVDCTAPGFQTCVSCGLTRSQPAGSCEHDWHGEEYTNRQRCLRCGETRIPSWVNGKAIDD